MFILRFLFTFTVVTKGNPPSLGLKAATGFEGLIVILNTHKLVNGTVYAFHITSNAIPTPIWFQIWREVQKSQFTLVGQIRHVSYTFGNYSVRSIVTILGMDHLISRGGG